MTKIVINQCFGGFSLSIAAVKLGRELSGDPRWAGGLLPGELYDDGSEVSDYGDWVHIDHDFPRTDPVLVQVVEKLGRKANGACAELSLEEIPPGTKYRIREYDGLESVETREEIEWSIA